MKQGTIIFLWTIFFFQCQQSTFSPPSGGSANSGYAVNGVINGLALGETIEINNNLVDTLLITGGGTGVDVFTFSTFLNTGDTYNVSVTTMPIGKSCVVSSGLGVVQYVDVNSIIIDCTPTQFSVGVNISGLAGTGLSFQLNNSEVINAGVDGLYVFSTKISTGSSYSVSILTQPVTPAQFCSVYYGTGTMGNVNITNVILICITSTFSVNGTVSGLAAGEVLVLQNSGSSITSVSGSGTGTDLFSFPSIIDGSTYNVSVISAPGTKTCVPGANTGIVNGANVSSVVVTCSTLPIYSIGGNISGLSGSLTIQNNSMDTLTLTSNGTFAFSTPLPGGSAYSITIQTQPSTPNQICTITPGSGSGIVGTSNVSTINITCVTNNYSLGGVINGLGAGEQILLANNGSTIAIVGTGTLVDSFMFSAINDGSFYNITINNAPSLKNCVIGANTGMINGSNVTSALVTCSPTPVYTVGGNIAGLNGTLVINNNVSDQLTVTANGSFTFAIASPDLASYAVTVINQPFSPAQICSISNGSGLIAAANVTNVSITCTTQTFTVSGNISGLAAGETVQIQNNGGTPIAITGAGSGSDVFQFTAMYDGSSYNISVLISPILKTCTAGSNTGTISGNNITNVTITCSTVMLYSVGGSINGLNGSLVIQNNGGDNLTISANGGFTFSTPLPATSGYAVTVLTQPVAPLQTCTVANSSGLITGTNITNVSINCVTKTYSVGGSISGLALGEQIILTNNGGGFIAIVGTGAASEIFVFAAQNDGSSYNVLAYSSPAGKTCTASLNSGTVSGANVTNVAVSCITNPLYTVSINVSGIATNPTGNLIVQYNGVPMAPITANGIYAFPSQPNGTNYFLSITTNPGGQICTISNPFGTLTGANITKTVSCGVLSSCGNGIIDIAETCDDGNTITGDGCSAFCQLEVCGNGILDVSEICDDGNTLSGDGCRADCLKIEICGDTVLDTGEICDDGNILSGDGCRADCMKIEICGDAVLDAGEICDDGNILSGDGCRADCMKIEICGDAISDAGEVCDDGNTLNGDGCRGDCKKIEICGDAILDINEQCDDGNILVLDGCSNVCLLENPGLCGNGALNPGETCDDANIINGDGCSSTCQIEPVNYTFETATLQGWTASAGGLWHVSTIRAAGTSLYSAHYAKQPPSLNNFDTGLLTTGYLTSPTFPVLASFPVLSFEYFLNGECSNGVVCNFDKLSIEIRTMPAGVWTQLVQLPEAEAGFLIKKINLLGYAGSNVQLRFYFNSVDSVSNAFEGAYVDNIKFVRY